MSDRQKERARRVVESFKQLLDQKAINTIPANDFDQLALFVEEALCDELHDAAEQLEALARTMRSAASLSEAGVGFV